MCVDDDLGSAESTCGFFRKFEQGAAMALPLHIRPDADETKACRSLVNEIDPNCAQDLAVAQQQMRKMTGRELARAVFVIRFVRQQGGEDRVARDTGPIVVTIARAADYSTEGCRPLRCG